MPDDRVADPHRILGIARGCSREEVKEAYRVLVLLEHPDHGGDERSFILIQDAYEQILAELDRDPKGELATPDRGPDGSRFPATPDPQVDDLYLRSWVDHVATPAAHRWSWVDHVATPPAHRWLRPLLALA